MPILLALLGKRWFWGAAGAVAIVAGLLFWHHSAIEKGIAEQVAADKAAAATLAKQTAAETATLQTKADEAEHAHDSELAALAAYRDSHPDGPVRLCIANAGGSGLPKTGPFKSGNESTGPGAGNVQPVPAGDSGLRSGAAGPDISGLLNALAFRADEVSAELREFQNRE